MLEVFKLFHSTDLSSLHNILVALKLVRAEKKISFNVWLFILIYIIYYKYIQLYQDRGYNNYTYKTQIKCFTFRTK